MRPFEREKVTFEYLLEILGDYLVNHAPSDVKVSTKELERTLAHSNSFFFFFFLPTVDSRITHHTGFIIIPAIHPAIQSAARQVSSNPAIHHGVCPHLPTQSGYGVDDLTTTSNGSR
jgi:hypothetical protein